MKTLTKSLLMAGIAWVTLMPAAAQDVEALEARITQLETMLAELKADMAKQKAHEDQMQEQIDQERDDIVRLEKTTQEIIQAAAASAEPTEVEGFRVRDTILKFGGFVDFDAHFTHLSGGAIPSNSIARDFHIPNATPVGGLSTDVVDFTAQASRFFLQGQRDINGVPLTGYIELDFLGSFQGNERVSSSFAPRIRRAYIDYGRFRVGQEWTTFQNTSSIPESASFLTLAEGQIFIRQPLARYTHGPFQLAVETPNTTVAKVGGVSLEADSNFIPDFIARYNAKGDWGNVSISAIARQLRHATPGDDSDTFGYGFSASGRINVFERSDIRFNVFGGEGVGRYAGLNTFDGAALNPITGELEAIPTYGGFFAYRHPFGETARINVGYSAIKAEHPDFIDPSEPDFLQSAFAAILWDLGPNLTVGGEVLYGNRELESGLDGDILRFTLSSKYAF